MPERLLFSSFFFFFNLSIHSYFTKKYLIIGVYFSSVPIHSIYLLWWIEEELCADLKPCEQNFLLSAIIARKRSVLRNLFVWIPFCAMFVIFGPAPIFPMRKPLGILSTSKVLLSSSTAFLAPPMILAPMSNSPLNGEATVPMSSFPTPLSLLRNTPFFPSSIGLVTMPVK